VATQRRKRLRIWLLVLTQYTNVTDSRTDRQTDAVRHNCISRVYMHSIARQKSLISHTILTLKLTTCVLWPLGIYAQSLHRLNNSGATLLSQTACVYVYLYSAGSETLPIESRIKFKLCVLIYRVSRGTAPLYLCELCKPCRYWQSTSLQIKRRLHYSTDPSPIYWQSFRRFSAICLELIANW